MFMLVNKEGTRSAPLKLQAQLDEVVPLLNKSLEGSIKRNQLNNAVYDALAAKSMLPDFDGPESRAWFPTKSRGRK